MPRDSLNCDSCHSRLIDKNNVKNYGGTILCRACSYSLEKLAASENENSVNSVQNEKLVSSAESSAMICDSESSITRVPSRLENLTTPNESLAASSSKKEKFVLEAEETKVKLNFKRFAKFTKRCFMCTQKENLTVIPYSSIIKFFVHNKVIIYYGTKCCEKHMSTLDEKHESIDCSYEQTYMSGDEVSKFLDKMCGEFSNSQTRLKKNGLNFDEVDEIPDKKFRSLMGVTKSDFQKILKIICEDDKKSGYRSVSNCLAMLLIKLWTGMSNDVIATLFDVDDSTVGRRISIAREKLIKKFVPKFLGVAHINHEDFVVNHSRRFAQKILQTENQAILVADATYIYIEKSQNYKFQRMSYSVHKSRPLVKPMMVVSTSGYILDVFGPYYANGQNNDSKILEHMLRKNIDDFKSWLHQDDLIIVDRGFRDCLDFLEELGINSKMPHFLPKKQLQHTSTESNESRIVTSVRWVIEAINGLIKNWKMLKNTVPNQHIPFIGDYVRIVCALCNAFRPARVSDNSADAGKAQKMLEKLSEVNSLQEFISENNLVSKRVCWEKVTDESVTDFPKLSVQDLKSLTFGVYQIKQAKSYTQEHLDDDGLYELSAFKYDDNLLRVKMQSRHTSSKIYQLWIKYDENKITGWYCLCKTGARTIGCCAHIAAVIWYLSYYRFEVKKSQINYDSFIHDAAVTASDDESSKKNMVSDGESSLDEEL